MDKHAINIFNCLQHNRQIWQQQLDNASKGLSEADASVEDFIRIAAEREGFDIEKVQFDPVLNKFVEVPA